MANNGDEDDTWLLIPDTTPVKFDSGEHADIPSECHLKFTANPNFKPLSGKAKQGALFVAKRCRPLDKYNPFVDWTYFDVTFAMVIAMAGDFYVNKGDKNDITEIICYGKDFDTRKKRFTGAVNDMLKDPQNLMISGYVWQGLDAYLNQEMSSIDEVMESKAKDELSKSEEGLDPNLGTSNITQRYKDRKKGMWSDMYTGLSVGLSTYGAILIWNLDHFGEEAWESYRAGHTLALEIAQKYSAVAKEKKWTQAEMKDANNDWTTFSEQKLKMAYLYDAFANHYLSDQFSAGHIRTPRPELNRPSRQLKGLTMLSEISSALTGGQIKPSRGAWDGMTGFIHETDNATGLRVKNERGDEWIAYGDAQYFTESNRINRLLSIECVQASIDEVYQTWLTGKYPDFCSDGIKTETDCDKFAALQIAPKFVRHTVAENQASSGNTACLWAVQQDQNQQTAKQKARLNLNEVSAEDKKKNEEEDKYEAMSEADRIKLAAQDPTNSIADPDKLKQSENGYFFLRRKDVEDCSLCEYQWGYPGLVYGMASADVAAIEKSQMKMQDLMPADARAVEILSGGFIQVQEYQLGDKLNYAVNVWGPVQVPINYFPEKYAPDKRHHPSLPDERKGVQFTSEERAVSTNRQMTFTFRGRRQELLEKPEVIVEKRNFRWRTWFDPSTRKTTLLKFTFSAKDPDNSITVESWSFTDEDPRTNQQWSHWESIHRKPRLVMGGPKDKPAIEIQKTVLIPFTSSDWESIAHVTRFFVLPFRGGSGPSNPDLVTFSFKKKDGEGDHLPYISVTSTENGVLSPKTKMTSDVADIDKSDCPKFSGFIKRFENVDKKAMILYARASFTDKEASEGLLILTTVFDESSKPRSIKTKMQLPLLTPPPKQVSTGIFGMGAGKTVSQDPTPIKKDFYQVLVGDARRSGHCEMVVVAGGWGATYINSFELTADYRWQDVSGPVPAGGFTLSKEATQLTEKQQTAAQALVNTPETRHFQYELCTLMPNEKENNGFNVVMVSTYDSPEGVPVSLVHFRVFLKDGGEVSDTVGDQPTKPAVEVAITAAAPAEKLIDVTWDDGIVTKVPASYFIPKKDVQTVKDDMIVVTSSTIQAGSIIPVPPTYWNGRRMVSGKFSFAGPFKPDTPRKSHGDYEAVDGDKDLEAQTCRFRPLSESILKLHNDTWYGCYDQDEYREVWFNDNKKQVLHAAEAKYGLFTRRWGRGDGPIEAEYFFDTKTNKPYAILYKVVYFGRKGDSAINWFGRVRIVNPSFVFKAFAQPFTAPINNISTAPIKAPQRQRPAAGWSSYVDCVVTDNFKYNKYFYSMGWRMCKTGSIINQKQPVYGIMQVFSFHGVIGCRVWAPRKKGDYQNWVSRGMNPYLGQTSLGTGYDSQGHWNDNASQLSWGATEDFEDMNVYHLATKSWDRPATMGQMSYDRGFVARAPKGAEAKT